MNSKTSLSDKLFSKALIKSDLRNNWMWAVVMTVILVLNILALPDDVGGYYSETYTNQHRFLSYCGISFFAALIFGLFVGTRLFSYLDKPNSVSCMHGLPFSRRKLYLSRIFSGSILIVFPALAASALMAIMSLSNSFITADCIAAFFAIFLIYAHLAFAIATFAMTVCGNVVVSSLFSCTIAAMPAALLLFSFGVCANNIYGFSYDGGIYAKILEFLYVFPKQLFPWRFSVYLGFILLFFVGGYFIYKLRPLENCEEVVAFKNLHGLFIYAVGLVCGMVGYLFFAANMGINNPIGMLPLGIIGVAVSTMIAKKSVNLRGTLKYILIFTVAVGTVSAIFAFDLFGVEKRVPKVQEVAYVSLENNYYYENETFVRYTNPDREIEDPSDIEKICALHKAYIADKKGAKNHGQKYHSDDNFTFRYHMKNGSTLERRYSYLSDENYEKYMIPVRNIDEYKEYAYQLIDTTEKELLSVRINDYRINDHEKLLVGKEPDARKLYDAVTCDLRRLPFEQLQSNGSLSVRFTYYIPGYYVSSPDYQLENVEKEDFARSCTIYINEYYTETLKVLAEMGISGNHDEDLEKISAIVVQAHSFGNEYKTYVPYDKSGEIKGVRITDPKEIKEIYDLCRLGTKPFLTCEENDRALNVEMVFINTSDERIWSYELRFLPEELPSSLKAIK